MRRDELPEPVPVTRTFSRAVIARVDALLCNLDCPSDFRLRWREVVLAQSVHKLSREAGAELLDAFKAPDIRFDCRDMLYELLNRMAGLKTCIKIDISPFMKRIELKFPHITGLEGVHIPEVVVRADYEADLRYVGLCVCLLVIYSFYLYYELGLDKVLHNSNLVRVQFVLSLNRVSNHYGGDINHYGRNAPAVRQNTARGSDLWPRRALGVLLLL